jgi:4-carboxymuconolactone decarboxylase
MVRKSAEQISPMHFMHFWKERNIAMDERERYEVGMRVRRSVLGDEHVDRAEATKNEVDSDFQNLISRYAWGEIWTRPGLTRQMRSMLTIAMLVALNRGEELRMHLRAAANNGVTGEEIREVLMHCAIYCGVPAANAAFHVAKEVLQDSER